MDWMELLNLMANPIVMTKMFFGQFFFQKGCHIGIFESGQSLNYRKFRCGLVCTNRKCNYRIFSSCGLPGVLTICPFDG